MTSFMDGPHHMQLSDRGLIHLQNYVEVGGGRARERYKVITASGGRQHLDNRLRLKKPIVTPPLLLAPQNPLLLPSPLLFVCPGVNW